jgi:hypothetical protein
MDIKLSPLSSTCPVDCKSTLLVDYHVERERDN